MISPKHFDKLIQATICERVREARLNLGWSQAQLAEAAYLAPSAVSHYERGERTPNPACLARLAVALNVSTDWLLGLQPSCSAPKKGL